MGENKFVVYIITETSGRSNKHKHEHKNETQLIKLGKGLMEEVGF